MPASPDSVFLLGGVLACTAGALVAPLLLQRLPRHGGLLLALIPLALLVGLLGQFGDTVRAGGVVLESRPWIAGLSVMASFRLDGLSMLMAVLVLGIGTLVVAYAGSYLRADGRAPRFFAYLMGFMASMLGLVLADNLLLLFVFWELTSLTSYLLIGYDHEVEGSRRAALQGFIVTVAGGLVMLAGIIVLGEAAGSYELSDILAFEGLLAQPGIDWALGLIVIGCLTKSAQFPFHFWLPNAMAAPSPVSAYLHSATMVKAGVYLLARLHPAFGEHAHWFWWLVPAGAVTMVLGGAMAFRSSGIKRVLAYTTVMALGTLTLLLGLGAEMAAVTFLLVHAFYKGSLFLVAGILSHEANTKDIHHASGLGRALPLTATFAALAALSAAGLPPFFGFIGKELLVEQTLHHGPWLALAAVLAAALVTAMVATLVLRLFGGRQRAPAANIHEAPWPMLLGPGLLAIGGLACGLLPGLAETALLAPAARAVGAEAVPHLALWHGLNLPLLLSGLSLATAVVLFLLWPRAQAVMSRWHWIDALGPDRGYWRLQGRIDAGAARLTAALQTGYLRHYVMAVMLVVLGLSGSALLRTTDWLPPDGLGAPVSLVPMLAAAVLAVAAFAALRAATALTALLSLGALGITISLVYVWFSAPDLAITQVLVETLTTILLMLILFRMPRFRALTTPAARRLHAVAATAFAVLITLLLWMVIGRRELPPIAEWLLEASVPEGHGHNVVNVILVDFRAFDTLGEIFVLALAAAGVFAMLRASGSDGAQDTRSVP